MMTLAEIVERGTETLANRASWDARQTLFDQMAGAGVPRANKPFPGAANFHVRLVDNTLRKQRTFWAGQAFTNDRLALFIARREQAAQLTQAAAEWFDYVLRHETNLLREFNFALWPMLLRGRGVLKAWVDGATRRLTFAGIDPRTILMAPGAADFGDADWFIHVKQLTRGAYERDARLRQDAWKSICGDQGATGLETAFWQEKQRREGITHTATEATAIIWEAWERAKDGHWLVHTLSPSRLDLPLREPFECPYRDLDGQPTQPFFSLVMEEAQPGWYAARGLGDLIGADEAMACRLVNDYLDALAFTTKPVFTFEGQAANATSLRFAPGEVLPGNLKRVEMGTASIELPTMLNWIQTGAEQSAMMPDFGITGKGRGDNRTATEVDRIASVMDVSTSYNGDLSRRRLCKIYEHCWALLLQYRPEELSYLLGDRTNTLPEEALHDQYSIRVGGSSDAWNRQANFQRAAARYQLLGADANASHEELVKDLLYADDAALAKRVFVPTNVRASSESFQEALQVLALKDGYPAPVMPDEDHAARIHVLLGALAKAMQTGEPLSPLGRQRLHEHLAVHYQFLKRKDPQAAQQVMAQAQQLEQAEQQMTDTMQAPTTGMISPENQSASQPAPQLTQTATAQPPTAEGVA